VAERFLYRVSEAAEALGLSRAFLYTLIAAGQLRPVRVGRAVRIPRAELERFVRELQEQAAETTGGVLGR
jgi:excisionase family DNA binding protein